MLGPVLRSRALPGDLEHSTNPFAQSFQPHRHPHRLTRDNHSPRSGLQSSTRHPLVRYAARTVTTVRRTQRAWSWGCDDVPIYRSARAGLGCHGAPTPRAHDRHERKALAPALRLTLRLRHVQLDSRTNESPPDGLRRNCQSPCKTTITFHDSPWSANIQERGPKHANHLVAGELTVPWWSQTQTTTVQVHIPEGSAGSPESAYPTPSNKHARNL